MLLVPAVNYQICCFSFMIMSLCLRCYLFCVSVTIIPRALINNTTPDTAAQDGKQPRQGAWIRY